MIQEIFDPSQFVLRTEENYQRHVELVERDPSIANQYGIKFNSPLNDLPSFHVTSGLPPDCMHDILEGVVPYEVGLILSKLLQEGVIT